MGDFVRLHVVYRGILVTVIGVVAVYIGNIFDEVKRRPSYIIDEKLNFE